MLVVVIATIVMIVGLGAHQPPQRATPSGRAQIIETVKKKPVPKFTKKIAAALTLLFAYLKAVADNYRAWWDWPAWRALGICEQGTQLGGAYDSNGDGIAWHGQPAGGSPGSGYPGGLGMSRAAWDAYRGAARIAVANGAYASPADQIRVGREEVRTIGGFRGWAAGTLACMARRFGVYVN